jgi:hypothetical protein
MKITVNEFKARKSLPYPKLMTDGRGLIVLMSDHECGTVVVAGEYHEVGHHTSAWNISYFYDFEGSIELQNER